MQLRSLVRIHTGVHFRGSIKADPTGYYRVVQVRDLDEHLRFAPDRLTRVALGPNVTPVRVCAGDVLFVARGNRPVAAPVEQEVDGLLAPNHFYILRPHQAGLLPGYLAWYINHPSTQVTLRSIAQGSHVHLIARSDLASLEVPVPTVAIQQRIVSLNRLRIREQEILTSLAEQRNQLISLSMLSAARTGTADAPMPLNTETR